MHVHTLITPPEVAIRGLNGLRAVVSWQGATRSGTVLPSSPDPVLSDLRPSPAALSTLCVSTVVRSKTGIFPNERGSLFR